MDRMRLGVVCQPVSGYIPQSIDTVWNEEDPVSLPPSENWRNQYFTCLDVTPFTTFEACIDNSQGCYHSGDPKPCLGLKFRDRFLGQWRFDREIILCDCDSYVLSNGKLGKMPSVFLEHRGLNKHDMSTHSEKLVPFGGTLEWWTGPQGASVHRTLPD